MTTDNRTNEPTEAQVESLTLWHVNAIRSIQGLPPVGAVDELASPDYSRDQVRAALVAAQGAAPQAESGQPWNDPSDPNSPKFDSPWEKAASLIKSIRGAQWDMLERRDQEDVRDEINGLIDRLDELATTMLTAPVLPSSGVDESKMAEVIRRADAEWQVREAQLETASELTHAQYVARAVAEWLKEQGR